MSTLLTSKQAAYHLGIKDGTLRAWRNRKRNKIPYRQYGKHGRVMYRIEEIEEFIKRCEVHNHCLIK
jgi:hypothetical protein